MINFSISSRTLTAGSFALLIACWPTMAQEKQVPPDDSTAPAEEKADEALDAARARGGDLITLTTGAIMSNVQVLRDTPKGYEIQVLEGMAPIVLPRKMVVSIEYDDIDPLHDKRMDKMLGKQDNSSASGQQLAPELMERLRKPVPGDAIIIANGDLIQIVKEIATRSNVKITIHPSVEQTIPIPERAWSVTTRPDLPLIQLLEKQLLTKFPALAIKYDIDHLTLITKDALAKETPPKEPLAP